MSAPNSISVRWLTDRQENSAPLAAWSESGVCGSPGWGCLGKALLGQSNRRRLLLAAALLPLVAVPCEPGLETPTLRRRQRCCYAKRSAITTVGSTRTPVLHAPCPVGTPSKPMEQESTKIAQLQTVPSHTSVSRPFALFFVPWPASQ